MSTAKAKLPPRRPQAERRHWVFVYRCGCPFGLVEESSNYKSEDDAAIGLHSGDAAHLAHEAERVESLPRTPVADTMRAMVDAERTWRRHLARLGGRG
jgi:hypothetical protein